MLTIKLGVAGLILLGAGASSSWARVQPVRPSPFDFSVEKPKKKKNIVEKILNYVDGGGFHGYDNPDGMTKKAEDPLGTKTVRLQLHF